MSENKYNDELSKLSSGPVPSYERLSDIVSIGFIDAIDMGEGKVKTPSGKVMPKKELEALVKKARAEGKRQSKKYYDEHPEEKAKEEAFKVEWKAKRDSRKTIPYSVVIVDKKRATYGDFETALHIVTSSTGSVVYNPREGKIKFPKALSGQILEEMRTHHIPISRVSTVYGKEY